MAGIALTAMSFKLLNQILPAVIELYQVARERKEELGQKVKTFSDADIIEMLKGKSQSTIKTAQAILDANPDPED